MKRSFTLICFLLLLSSLLYSQATRREAVMVTVYNQNFALVKDQRSIFLVRGVNEIKFTDVAALIEPESVLFRPLSSKFFPQLLEQNYEFDLLNTEKLMSKYIDQEIKVVGKEEEVFKGILKSFEKDGLLLQLPEGNLVLIKMDNVREVEFTALPEGLITRPTLVWQIKSERRGKLPVEVSYITKGINWKADYVARIEEKEKFIDLKGWVTIDNRSGATYKDASLKLVAGEVHRVEKAPVWKDRLMMAKEAGAPPQFEEKPFFEYHIYTLNRKTTLKNNQIKQISLLSAQKIPIKKIYTYDGAKRFWRSWMHNPRNMPCDKKVGVSLQFKNSRQCNLGIPLPKGKVRVYKVAEGGMEFVGEDEIDHTPKDEEVRIFLGNAFDLVGERKCMDWEKIARGVWEASYQINLRNHKKEEVEIEVIEHLWGDWEILRSSHPWKKRDAYTVKFPVKVKPDSEEIVTYTVRYRW